MRAVRKVWMAPRHKRRPYMEHKAKSIRLARLLRDLRSGNWDCYNF